MLCIVWCAAAVRMRVYLLVVALAVCSRCEDDKPYKYQTEYLATPLDHFSFANNNTFKLRYLLNDTYWKVGSPIFFYTGNEGDIEVFAQNTGFMWETAPKFNAMLVFAEHRYYGKTMPFGDKSYSNFEHLGYLTSTQALADFAYLIDYLQTSHKSDKTKRCPVVVFGGSYGGMLSAWMRLKYPHMVDIAVASSAPVFQFQGLTNCNTFNNIVAKVYKTSSVKGNCVRNIKKSWSVIRNITSTKEGKAWLSSQWKTCDPVSDEASVRDFLEELYGNVAMINYPYSTSFLAKVPAHPVRAVCQELDDRLLDGKDLLVQLQKALSVYTNYTGSLKCLQINQTTQAFGELGWDFQACTELVMPMCTDENNEMFEKSPWDIKKYADDCFKKFGTRLVRDDLAILEYGGKEADYSNLIFTNGLLDPWSPGGFLDSKSQSVYTFLMPEAAHHLDLRASNPSDPGSVVNARAHIKSIIHGWLKIFHETY